MTSDPSAADIHGRDFPAGAVVFEEGDPGSRMYVLQSGTVRILKRLGAREIDLAPGEVVDAFLRYVELRARWHALAAGEDAEVPDLASDGSVRVATELLRARLPPEGPPGARASALDDTLALKRRFEPDEGGRNTT